MKKREPSVLRPFDGFVYAQHSHEIMSDGRTK
jgi:hypothetical protein